MIMESNDDDGDDDGDGDDCDGDVDDGDDDDKRDDSLTGVDLFRQEWASLLDDLVAAGE